MGTGKRKVKMGKGLCWYIKKNIDVNGMGLVHINSEMPMGEIYNLGDNSITLDPSRVGGPISIHRAAWGNYKVVEKYNP